ncbi:phosphoenolpyruvate mutase [Velocimicrobium porci]|uniref:phosphoenolpyruvate mutase n=1 Tax=Velocimicrobium porci TaxID=2606634 RepID=A0A6L5XYS8_9FIRM|nr:phosphoenolpyruvate mutase [Velocimicrobium porci]MSS63854.1 phosphoenolpyruvate mutase [Velocimicrobium porci]
MKKIYACFCTDVIHEGHLNIIEQAKQYGEVIAGVLSDQAMIKYNRFPIVSFEERKRMLEEIPGISEVVVQKEVMYEETLKKLKPDYVIHGDNWKSGPMEVIRNNVIETLKEWGGELIEIPYTYNERVSNIEVLMKEKAAMPEYRRKRLRLLLKLCPIVKTIEVHSGLTGLIAEKTIVANDGEIDQFDAMWLSSLCDSTVKGKPDIELVDMSSRLRTVDDILEVTTKPIILDGDTGGLIEHFVYNVRTLERMGVSAVIIEDKTGLKKNSLFGTEVEQTQDTIEGFCAKIKAGKKAQRTEDFMIIARIESLILEKGMKDALARAIAYTEAGADGIMIHSRRKEPTEIFEFCDRFREINKDTPIVVVPTSYNQVTEEELYNHGINIVIYANQLTRSAFPAMQQTATDILKYHRAKEVDERLMPIKEILTLIDEL